MGCLLHVGPLGIVCIRVQCVLFIKGVAGPVFKASLSQSEAQLVYF